MEVSVIYPPNPFPHNNNYSIFLAGTIDMGNSIDWQQVVIEQLTKMENGPMILLQGHETRTSFDNQITIFNPRRKDWDSSWVQEIENPQFFEQVNWELDALEKSDCIILFFEKNSKSPISLLELGLFADSQKMIVCCESWFWRKGNVEIVCQRKGIPFFDNFETFMEFLNFS